MINIFKKIDDKLENFTGELESIVKNKIVLGAEKSNNWNINIRDEFKSTLDIEEGRISEQQNRFVENIQTEAKRAEKMESYWIDNMWYTVLGLTY